METKKMTRRDKLAIGRTHLSNERTMLSYWQTSLAFIVLGAFLIRQSPLTTDFMISAAIAVIFGTILFIFGTVKFYQFKKVIDKQ